MMAFLSRITGLAHRSPPDAETPLCPRVVVARRVQSVQLENWKFLVHMLCTRDE